MSILSLKNYHQQAAAAGNAELEVNDEIAVEFDDPSLPAPAFMVGPGRAPVLELDLEAAISALKVSKLQLIRN